MDQEQVKCPKCGKMGTLRHNQVRDSKGKPKEYWEVVHSETIIHGLRLIHGCYLGKKGEGLECKTSGK